MTAPSYTTDLSTICLMETGDTFEEFSGYALGDNAVLEGDWYLQGALCASDENNNKTGVGHSIGFDYGSAITFNSGDVFLGWMFYQGPNAVDTFANGGYRVLMGSTTANYKGWAVGGSDFGRNPYGGWVNVAVDPTVAHDYILGTAANWTHFAIAYNCVSGSSKGRPVCADAFRMGRAEVIIEYGETANYGTFAGIAAQNDAQANKWGLFQEEGVGYLYKGLLSFGNATNLCDFRDSNVAITIDMCPKVTASFNKIEITHASSRVDWTSVSITSMAGTDQASKGSFEVITAAADVNFDLCTFTDMLTWIFGSGSIILNTVFRRTDLVTANGATFTGCTFEEITNAVSILCSTTSNIEGCTFTSDGSNHAIKIDTPGTYDLDDNIFSNYAVIDGSGGNEVIFNDSGGQVTINASGNTGVLSVRNGASATTTLNEDLITFKLTGLPANTEVTIVNASTRAELFHIENSSGDVTHTYTTGGTVVDVLIHHVDYDPHVGTLLDYTLPSISTTLPISLVLDNTFSNP